MRATSNTYKTLRTQTGSFYEVEVIRGAKTYTMEDLVSVNISPKLFEGDGPSIGNAISSLCYLTLIETSENWPRMAEFSVRVRLSSEDGLTKSEWLSMGTYYTDTRRKVMNGWLSITGYDAMLMYEQYWTDVIDDQYLPNTWPITSKAWIDLMKYATTGVGNLLPEFADFPTAGGVGGRVTLSWSDDRMQAHVQRATANTVDLISIYDPWPFEMPDEMEYNVPYLIHFSTTDTNVKMIVDCNGDSQEYTGDAVFTVTSGYGFYIMLKVAKNCAVDADITISIPKKIEVDSRSVIDNTVPLIGLDTTSTIRDVLKTIAAANGGNWVVGFDGKLRLVPFVNLEIDSQAIAGVAIAGIAIVGYTGGILPSGIGSTNIGLNAQHFENSAALKAITGVYLYALIGAALEAGTDGGYVLKGMCNYVTDDGVAALCLSKVSGYIYKPFSATQATLDPAAEPGDIVIINGESYQMMDIDWNICTWPTATIAAAHEEEVDHEFTFWDETAKYYRKTEESIKETETAIVESTSSLIQQTAESITMEVEQNYYTKDDVDEIQLTNTANFTVTSEAIQAALSQIGAVGDEVEAINYYIRYEVISGVGTVIVGQTNSLAELHITNTQISLIYNGDVISYWNQNKQYTPKQLEIPTGGSLRIGNLLVQPRTSGNVSVMWLGETN